MKKTDPAYKIYEVGGGVRRGVRTCTPRDPRRSYRREGSDRKRTSFSHLFASLANIDPRQSADCTAKKKDGTNALRQVAGTIAEQMDWHLDKFADLDRDGNHVVSPDEWREYMSTSHARLGESKRLLHGRVDFTKPAGTPVPGVRAPRRR